VSPFGSNTLPKIGRPFGPGGSFNLGGLPFRFRGCGQRPFDTNRQPSSIRFYAFRFGRQAKLYHLRSDERTLAHEPEKSARSTSSVFPSGLSCLVLPGGILSSSIDFQIPVIKAMNWKNHPCCYIVLTPIRGPGRPKVEDRLARIEIQGGVQSHEKFAWS
jgi:hypothetical protein